jgi:hypothetical protein
MQQVSGSYSINVEIPCVAVRLVRRLWMICYFVQHHSALFSQTALDCGSICPQHLFTVYVGGRTSAKHYAASRYGHKRSGGFNTALLDHSPIPIRAFRHKDDTLAESSAGATGASREFAMWYQAWPISIAAFAFFLCSKNLF